MLGTDGERRSAQASEVIWGYRNREGAKRVGKQVTSGVKAVIYAAQPFGRFLLTAVALGFVTFGLFAVLQSRYRRM